MAVDTDKLRADQKRGLVVGVVPTDGSQELRLEIDDFLADKDLANLYFLALEAFMSKDIYEDPFSYYEISGIHGMPYRAWDHVESVSGFSHAEKRHPAAGYCAHGSVVFPTWHRVYLAQFEVSADYTF
jgi:tyrosinase